MKNKKEAIKIALYGMDERACKTMAMYLKGPCKGIAVVTNEVNADIDLIDADYSKAKELLDERKSVTPDRPLILLSLEEVLIEGTFFVKKPIEIEALVAAIKQATSGSIKKTKPIAKKEEKELEKTAEIETTETIEPPVVEKKKAATKHVDSEEVKKTSKHRTAKDLTESKFSAYMGHIEGVDFSDPEHLLKASFNAKEYFFGYVQSALNVCKAKGRILQLNSGWKPLLIFPQSQEVWLDADDKQLRAFAGLSIKKNASKGMSLSPIEKSTVKANEKMENFYDSDYFLWKLAVWTSKGRYPDVIDINKPVYLKQWPNFTRLLVTPHSMRIAALLVREPRTAMSIANALKIKPQYVFVFISAANSLGLVGQAKRQSDVLIAPAKVKASKAKGLLSRILGRLRG